MGRRLLGMVLVAAAAWPSYAAAGERMPVILSMRERAQVRDSWTRQRLERLVPKLMREVGVDMWLVISREYNEDPVFETMAPSTWMAARRRTILVFLDRGDKEGVERLAVSRYPVGDFFDAAWNPEEQPDQWRRLAQLIEERDPRRIAINSSTTYALADGLTSSERRQLEEALPDRFVQRLESGENLAVRWLETRIPAEMEVYPTLCSIAHRIIAEGFSNGVIQPGVTSTDDVQWWYRERIRELKLSTWFHPSVSVQRAHSPEHSGSFASRQDVETIRHGDLLHVDFGITYLGLNTDTQQHAYVLRRGEEEAPAGLREAFRASTRLQDILTSHFRAGKTGNEILAESLARAKAEGLRPSIYTHPIGFHGHGAGPVIGMWDKQDGVPGTGDRPLMPDTAFSIELNTTSNVPEWDGREVRIMLEEDAYFDGERVRYIDGRQTELILIRP